MTLLNISDSQDMTISHSVFNGTSEGLEVDMPTLDELAQMHIGDTPIRLVVQMAKRLCSRWEGMADPAMATVLGPLLERMSAAEEQVVRLEEQLRIEQAGEAEVRGLIQAAEIEMCRRYGNRPLPAEVAALFGWFA
jgi:hypothetical protein